MSAVLLATTFTHVLPAKASGTTVEKTIDFEEGTTDTLTVIDGNDQNVDISELVTSTNNTKALNINQSNLGWVTAYYQPEIDDLGDGAEYALPSNVQFRFKAYQEDDANLSPNTVIEFEPILRMSAGQHIGRFPKISIGYANYYTWGRVDRIKLQTSTDSLADSIITAAGADSSQFDVASSATSSIDDATWYTANCAYDWSDYRTSHEVTCTFTIANASGVFATYTETYTMKSSDFINQKAYGFGFKDTGTSNTNCCIDDIKVTLISEPPTKSETPEEDTPKGAYIDFEEGTTDTLAAIDGNDQNVDISELVTSTNNTKVFNINQSSDGWTTAYYQPEIADFGDGVEYVLPSNVQFRFKAYQEDNDMLPPKAVIEFEPILRMGTGTHIGRFPKISIGYANYYTWGQVDRIILQTSTDSAADSIITAAGAASSQIDVASSATSSIDDATWYTANCAYDWNDYSTSHEVTCTFTIANASGVFATYTETYTMKSSDFINQKAYGFGFKDTSTDNTNCCIDDIAVTLVSIDSEGNSTIHTPNVPVVPAVKGATISTTNQTIKMGFTFTEAQKAISLRGETVQKYGAVLVAGTQTLDTMKIEAAKFMDDVADNENVSYVCTARTDSTLPDIYSVTITNSNTDTDGTDNRGKRATAIAYVVTDQGVYYSDAIINHSVMSVVKEIFNGTYLTDTENVKDGALVEGSLLDKALGNSTYADLTAALTAAPTNATQRDLLLNVHFALNKQ